MLKDAAAGVRRTAHAWVFGLFGFVLLADARALVAQARFDTITTPRGKCAVWASIPGGSNGNEAINRCALDRGLGLLTTELELPAPRTELRAHGEYTVVVNPDGTVDPPLTRAWTLSTDSAWNARTLATIRRWRFEPGVRNGVAVRSGFRLGIWSDARNDTLPARLDWARQPYVDGDSLIGTWVVEAKAAPLRTHQVDSIHLALLRRLVATKIVQANLFRPSYCLVMEDGDSLAHRRLIRMAQGIVYHYFDMHLPPPYGCERRPNTLRILMPRVHLTENGRAVLYTAGDYLKDWPVGFDEKTYRAWHGRCVADVPPAGSVRIDCMILPDHAADLEFILRVLRERTDTVARDTAHQMTVIAMSPGAYQKDTMRVRVVEVPRTSERAVRDSVPACAGMRWGTYAQQDSAALYIVKAEFEKLDRMASVNISAAGSGRSPSSFRGSPCNAPDRRYRTLLAFALGDVGEPLRQPITLCIQEAGCRRSYIIDPVKHTLAEQAHLRFNFADLRPDTRTGQQLAFRIYTNRAIQGQVPLVILRIENRWLAWIPREINPQEWEFGLHYENGLPQDAQIRIYLFVFD